MASFEDHRYISSEESADERGSGAKLLPLLEKISKPCRFKDNTPKKKVRCIASRTCGKTWSWPRNRQRIIKHAAHECKGIPKDLRREAVEYLAKKAKGPKAEIEHSGAVSDAEIDDSEIEIVEPEKIVEMGPARKKVKTSGSVATSQLAKFTKSYVTEGRKVLKEKADHALMLFVTCTGIPPRVIDSKEFRDLCSTLNPSYNLPCASTLSEMLIPDEAAKILTAIHEFLRKERDLTITFDGGKIRRQKSFYSIHVITAARESFLLELDDASMLSHTAAYIIEQLDEVRATVMAINFNITHLCPR